MSRESDAREKYTDNTPGYGMVGTIQKHNKEINLDILCELIRMNDREEAKEAKSSAVLAKEAASVPTRSKATPNS